MAFILDRCELDNWCYIVGTLISLVIQFILGRYLLKGISEVVVNTRNSQQDPDSNNDGEDHEIATPPEQMTEIYIHANNQSTDDDEPIDVTEIRRNQNGSSDVS